MWCLLCTFVCLLFWHNRLLSKRAHTPVIYAFPMLLCVAGVVLVCFFCCSCGLAWISVSVCYFNGIFHHIYLMRFCEFLCQFANIHTMWNWNHSFGKPHLSFNYQKKVKPITPVPAAVGLLKNNDITNFHKYSCSNIMGNIQNSFKIKNNRPVIRAFCHKFTEWQQQQEQQQQRHTSTNAITHA